MAAHSKFPPSSMFRTVLCPASWIETHSRPDQPPSEAAQHGTLLHEYVVRAYENGRTIVKELRKSRDRAAVLECLDYLDAVVASCKDEYEIGLEKVVSLEGYGLPDIWGTADVIVYDKYEQTVHVIDWKFGTGVKVYAHLNNQGIAYMAGAAAEYPNAKHFVFHLVQSPLDHFDSFDMERENLENYVENVFKLAVIEAIKDQPEYRPSVHACQFCIARNECVARHDLAIEQAKKVFQTHRQLPKITHAQMKEFLDLKDDLNKAISDMEKHAYNLLKEGKDPNIGYKLVHGRSARNFKDKKAAAKWLLQNTFMDSDLLFITKLKSPAQIEKEEKLLKKDDDFQNLIATTKGKLSVVKDSDPREAWKPIHDAMRVFKKVVNE